MGPNPEYMFEMDDGVRVPLGKPIDRLPEGETSDLLYNEYVVYDEAQCRMRYLCKIKFNWRV